MSNIKNKSKKSLETESFEVSVINDPEMRPFLNVFQAEGKNVREQKLGKVFGIIQVDDSTENSAYLPNLLTQVFKKEYYKNKNKTCGQSFEIALHKMNLTLTELAQHEIVKWINNLNAVVGVICGKEIHFTQIGKGAILFLKDKKIIKMDSDTANAEDYHPMKTFSSISAGRIKNEDKIIFTIKETFKTLKIEELERHFKTFNSNEFDNIISSTLRNEGSNTGMLVINIKEDQGTALENITTPEPTVEEDFNFFGKNKPEKEKNELLKTPKVNSEGANELLKTPKVKSEETLVENQDDATQFDKNENLEKKTPKNSKPKSPFEQEPEIFLKETEIEQEDEHSLDENKFYLKISKENYQKKLLFLKEIFQKWMKKPAIKKISFNKVKIDKLQKDFNQNFNKKSFNSFFKKIKKQFSDINWDKKKKNLLNFWIKVKELSKKFTFIKTPSIPSPRSSSAEPGLQKRGRSAWKILDLFSDKFPKETINKDSSLSIGQSRKNEKVFTQKEKTLVFKEKIRSIYQKITFLFKNFWSKVTKKFNSLDNKKKIVLFFSIIFIVLISSLIFWLFNKKPSEKEQIISSGENQITLPVEEEKEISSLTNLINLNKKIKDTTLLNGELFFLTENDSLIKYSIRDNKKTEILLPENFRKGFYLSPIESLQIVLIISEDQVLSYSPVTNKFYENNIILPENFENIGAGTYLTYLYLLDKTNGQIYRYHRATGGFGEFKEWLDENQNMSDVISFDVSDSIYLGFEDGRLEKYFDGIKIKSFNLEKDFKLGEIRVKPDQEELFALDSEKGIIIKLLENKNQQNSFEDKNFKDAQTFTVDFDDQKVYLVNNDEELLVFSY
jgi:hypothetical protein